MGVLLMRSCFHDLLRRSVMDYAETSDRRLVSVSPATRDGRGSYSMLERKQTGQTGRYLCLFLCRYRVCTHRHTLWSIGAALSYSENRRPFQRLHQHSLSMSGCSVCCMTGKSYLGSMGWSLIAQSRIWSARQYNIVS